MWTCCVTDEQPRHCKCHLTAAVKAAFPGLHTQTQDLSQLHDMHTVAGIEFVTGCCDSEYGHEHSQPHKIGSQYAVTLRVALF